VGASRVKELKVKHGEERPLLDLVAELDLQFLDHTGMGRRNLHRRLVAFHRDQRLLRLDGVAGLHQQLDDRDFIEVADVRDLDFNEAHRTSRRAAPREGLAPSGGSDDT
jgi:hypothetical protein